MNGLRDLFAFNVMTLTHGLNVSEYANMTKQKTTISQQEAARRLGTSAGTIAKAIQAGQLKAVRIGAHRRVIADSVDDLLTQNDRRAWTTLATVQAAVWELFGTSANRERCEKLCATLGFAPSHGSVDRAVLERLKALSENGHGKQRVRAIVNERSAN